MAKEPYLEAGKIINTFGVRGEVKLDPWCDSAEFLKPLKTLYIDGAPRAVASSRVHKGMLIVRFADVEDVNGAMLLKNKIAYFARSESSRKRSLRAPSRTSTFFWLVSTTCGSAAATVALPPRSEA